MNRQELAHVLRAASRIAEDVDVVVIGSQSILGTHDEDELPAAAIASVEADIAFWEDHGNRKSDAVDGAIGEDSAFHSMNGYYAQGVSISTAVLPTGWQERVVIWETRSSHPGRAHCLDSHDLAVSKLVAGREKDHEFVGALLIDGLLDLALLRTRTELLPPPRARIVRVIRWLEGWDTKQTRLRDD